MGADIVSAGGVVYRVKNGATEIKLITTKNWSYTIPKGRIEKDEHLEECAIREVREESGVKATIEDYLGTAQWKLKSGKRKVVYVYLMKCVKDGKTNDPDNETIKTEWKPIDEAIELVEFPPMRKLLLLAAKRLGKNKNGK